MKRAVSLQQRWMVASRLQRLGESHQLPEISQVRGTQAVYQDEINKSLTKIL